MGTVHRKKKSNYRSAAAKKHARIPALKPTADDVDGAVGSTGAVKGAGEGDESFPAEGDDGGAGGNTRGVEGGGAEDDDSPGFDGAGAGADDDDNADLGGGGGGAEDDDDGPSFDACAGSGADDNDDLGIGGGGGSGEWVWMSLFSMMKTMSLSPSRQCPASALMK
jgi:hypothetical protein